MQHQHNQVTFHSLYAQSVEPGTLGRVGYVAKKRVLTALRFTLMPQLKITHVTTQIIHLLPIQDGQMTVRYEDN